MRTPRRSPNTTPQLSGTPLGVFCSPAGVSEPPLVWVAPCSSIPPLGNEPATGWRLAKVVAASRRLGKANQRQDAAATLAGAVAELTCAGSLRRNL